MSEAADGGGDSEARTLASRPEGPQIGDSRGHDPQAWLDRSDSIAIAPAGGSAPHGRLLYNRHGEWRAPWRLLMFLALGLFLSLQAAFLSSLLVPMSGDFDPSSGFYYVLLCLAWTLSALFMLRFADRADDSLSAMGLSLHPKVGREVLFGACLGLAVVGLVWVVQWSLGWMVVKTPGDIDPLGLTTTFALLFFAAFYEELLFRGYAFQVLLQALGRWPSILITSVLFGVAHNSNPNANWLSLVDTTLAGVLIALTYERSRSLWIPTLLHVFWNFTMGVILGLEVSGLVMPSRLLESELTLAGYEHSLWTGGSYGPEAGLLLLLVVLPFIAVLALSPRRPIDAYRPIWYRDERARDPGESARS